MKNENSSNDIKFKTRLNNIIRTDRYRPPEIGLGFGFSSPANRESGLSGIGSGRVGRGPMLSPIQIDTFAMVEPSKDEKGLFSVDGDDTVPTLGAKFMCAKFLRKNFRFDPSGTKQYARVQSCTTSNATRRKGY